MKIETATNWVIGVFVAGIALILWPLTIGAVVSIFALSPIQGKWWGSPATFMMTMIVDASLCIITGYPSYG